MGVLPHVVHLGAGVCLLVAPGHGYGIEFTYGIIPAQDAAGVLPGDGGTSFHLGPGNVRTITSAVPALGDEVVNAADAVFISGIPVLHRGVLDLCIFHGDEFHHGRVELVFIPHGRSAAFKVTDETALVCNDEGTLELAGFGFIDTEIGR